MFVDQPPSEMDGVFRRPSRSEVSSRRVQRPCRCTQPSRASCGDRVVSPPSGGEGTSSCVGQSVDRSVRDLPQREAAPVLLACPGSTGRLRGCVSSSLGRPGPLRVPSLCSGRSGDRSRPTVIASRDDSGRTSLAREGVVRRLAASADPTTPGSSLLGHAASAAPLQPVPSRRPRAEPSRVATLKRHYRKSGFSGRAAQVLSGVLRESSSRLYQSRWKIFCGWCRGRSVAPVNASVPVGTEWSLHPQVARALLRAWGSPSIDLFAICLNAKLPLYCSLVPDPQAVFEDAFRHPWDDLDLYAFPPFALVGRVIARVQQSSQVAMTLVATSLAREGVVRRLAASADPTTPGSSLLGHAASAAPLQPVPSRRPRAEPSRVATLK